MFDLSVTSAVVGIHVFCVLSMGLEVGMFLIFSWFEYCVCLIFFCVSWVWFSLFKTVLAAEFKYPNDKVILVIWLRHLCLLFFFDGIDVC